MNVKYIAAAVAAIGATGAQAAALNPASDTPDVVVYIAGASAQKNALANAVPAAVFATPADVVQINGSVSTGPDLLGLTSKVSSQAWYGMSIPSLTGGTSKKLLVVYNGTNGSAAGLNQLIAPSTFTTVEHLNIVLPTSCAGVTTAGTVATPDGSLTMPNYTCNTLAPIAAADLALSDVAPSEFAPGIVQTGFALTTKRTGLEGFGVIVNAATYSALQAQNIADGLLPSSCAGDNTTAACQASIRSADYAAIANQNNSATMTSAFLVPSAGAAELKLCRRDAYSGTQASSNIFFLDSVCGTLGYKGALPAVTAADSTAAFSVVENAATGAVESCVSGASGYSLGVVSTGESEGAADSATGARSYRFVKIDGVSPNADSLNRSTMIRGDYKFAMDMTASYKKTTATSAASIKVANAIITDLTKTSKSNLKGIGYIDTVIDAAKSAKYTHGGNNCSPLH